MATLLKSDGTKTEVTPTDGRAFSLEEMRKLIGGGYIEILSIPNDTDNKVLVVDEEGKLKRNLLPNREATKLFGQILLGNCILSTRTEAGFNDEDE
jgi:hypothetical protein